MRRLRWGPLLTVGAFLAPAIAAALPITAWRLEVVDAGFVALGELDIAIDSSGVVHVVYARVGDLVYAQQRLGMWTEDLFVAGEGGASIAIGPDDRPHIAYGYGEARYATLQNGVWVQELVHDGQGWTVGGFSDIAVDSSSRVHMVFRAQQPYSPVGLAYAKRDEAGWGVEWLATGPSSIVHAIAVDSTGQPHVVFPADGPGRLVYMTKTEGGWQTETIANEWGAGADIAIDSKDRPHVVYHNAWGGNVYHLVKDGGVWTRGLVRDGTGVWDTALALDSDDIPHVVFSENICFCWTETLTGHLRHTARMPQGWTSPSLVDGEGHPEAIAIAIDSTDTPRVLYNVLWSQAAYAFTTVRHYDLRFAEPATAVPSRLVPYVG